MNTILNAMIPPIIDQSVYDALNQYMVLDKYGHSSIRNIYFDTDNFLLIRRSIEKPVYKEKLRFRSYGRPEPDGEVFIELKKKYKKVVYKRRITMPLDKAMRWFTTDTDDFPHTQIGQEIDYLRVRYPDIRPAMLLTYEREAYYAKDGSDLRITIDSNILARIEDVDLTAELGGHSVLPKGHILMEIKTMYGYPKWLTDVLDEQHLYKTSFTKYGNAYKEMILGQVPEDFRNLPGEGKETVNKVGYPILGYGGST